MKKLTLFVISVLMLTSVSFSANAQKFVIKAGITSSQQDIKNLNIQNIKDYTSFQIGIGYQTRSVAGFSVQPELVYNRKGSKINDANWELSYLQVPVNIQWGPDLLIVRPFIQATPFVGFCLSNKLNGTGDQTIVETTKELASKLEYGLALGGGVELFDLVQVTAKYAWNFGKVAGGKEYAQNVGQIRNTPHSLEITVGVKF
ncbi:MAG: PorT family protein [Bacteroidales bacterium]|nr:PorT family protein [Bacteroidales bacterium]